MIDVSFCASSHSYRSTWLLKTVDSKTNFFSHSSPSISNSLSNLNPAALQTKCNHEGSVRMGTSSVVYAIILLQYTYQFISQNTLLAVIRTRCDYHIST